MYDILNGPISYKNKISRKSNLGLSSSTKRPIKDLYESKPSVESSIVFEGKSTVRNYKSQVAPPLLFSAVLHPKSRK